MSLSFLVVGFFKRDYTQSSCPQRNAPDRHAPTFRPICTPVSYVVPSITNAARFTSFVHATVASVRTQDVRPSPDVHVEWRALSDRQSRVDQCRNIRSSLSSVSCSSIKSHRKCLSSQPYDPNLVAT